MCSQSQRANPFPSQVHLGQHELQVSAAPEVCQEEQGDFEECARSFVASLVHCVQDVNMHACKHVVL